MKALFLTNEYPPNIYGGAGVHVDYLSRELAKLMRGGGALFRRTGVVRHESCGARVRDRHERNYTCPKPLRSVFGAVQRCLDFNTTEITADVVHCHTWYSHFGGILAKLNYGLPLVDHGAFARAVASLEARATRRRLRFHRLAGEDGAGNGGRGDRGVARDEEGCRRAFRDRARTAARDL